MTQSRQINLRLSDAEYTALTDAAARADCTVSEWARLVLAHAAGKHELLTAMRRAEMQAAKLAKASSRASKG